MQENILANLLDRNNGQACLTSYGISNATENAFRDSPEALEKITNERKKQDEEYRRKQIATGIVSIAENLIANQISAPDIDLALKMAESMYRKSSEFVLNFKL